MSLEQLKTEKETAIIVAIDFGYHKNYPGLIARINQAKTPIEIDNILTTCRKRFL